MDRFIRACWSCVRALGALIITVGVCTDAEAIIRRHDRDDAKYRALGEAFPMAGHLGGRVGCTLIAPQWAITAAHTIEDIQPFVPLVARFGDRDYVVDRIVIHPQRAYLAVDSSADLALLHLATPVEGIEPAKLYDRFDEADKMVTLVGRGMSGTGETGPTIERGVLRGATTIIEGALENSLLSWFDAPPEGTELEGATGPGDSGSGAFIRDDRSTWLVAVCSFTAGSEAPPPRRHYGSFSGLARISTRRDWIAETISSPGGVSLWSPLAAFHGDETAYKKRARAFVDAFNSVDQQRVASFISGNLPPGKRPASESAAGWMPVIGEYAPYRVCGYSSDRNGRKALLVYSERAKIFRGVMLEISKDAPHLITSIDMWDATVPEDTPCRG